MIVQRRSFLQLLGLGAAVAAVEPVRRIWQVGVQLETSTCPRKWWHDIKYDREAALTLSPLSERFNKAELRYSQAANTYFQDKYAHSEDPHSTLAADLMRLPLEKAVLRPDFARYRAQAKEWNFGSAYGMSGADLAAMLKKARLVG